MESAVEECAGFGGGQREKVGNEQAATLVRERRLRAVWPGHWVEALLAVSWGQALGPEPLPVPRECTCPSLTGDDLATTPEPWGHASAGAEQGLVKPLSGMQGKGPELAQC